MNVIWIFIFIAFWIGFCKSLYFCIFEKPLYSLDRFHSRDQTSLPVAILVEDFWPAAGWREASVT